MDDGFPQIPEPYQYVRFDKEWGIVTGGGSLIIPVGTIGKVLSTETQAGYDHDLAGEYKLYVAVIIKQKMYIIKFPYSERLDVLSVMPDTVAARVLFGKKNGKT